MSGCGCRVEHSALDHAEHGFREHIPIRCFRIQHCERHSEANVARLEKALRGLAGKRTFNGVTRECFCHTRRANVGCGVECDLARAAIHMAAAAAP
jgi:hypothetical protein